MSLSDFVLHCISRKEVGFSLIFQRKLDGVDADYLNLTIEFQLGTTESSIVHVSNPSFSTRTTQNDDGALPKITEHLIFYLFCLEEGLCLSKLFRLKKCASSLTNYLNRTLLGNHCLLGCFLLGFFNKFVTRY